MEAEDVQALEEAVARQIKRKRKEGDKDDRPISIDERRALGKENIMALVKQLSFNLASWPAILNACKDGKLSR